MIPKKSRWVAGFRLLVALSIASVCGWVFPGFGDAAEQPVEGIDQVQKLYAEGKFKEVVDSVKPWLKVPETIDQAERLQVLALARMAKTPEAIKAYDRRVERSKREDEGLLRQLAIASILPARADMREQVRGAAYTALKEIDSPEMVKYLEEGLTDGSGMIRALLPCFLFSQ